MHLNEHSDFHYRYLHGDKETFHLAWRRLRQPYAMPRRRVEAIPGTLCQHDFTGRRLFQHRNMDKWQLHGGHTRVPGFRFEPECNAFLRELADRWDTPGVRRYRAAERGENVRALAAWFTATEFMYHRVGHDHRPLRFRENGRIGRGAGGCEVYWDLRENAGRLRLEISAPDGLIARAEPDEDGVWRGAWVRFEKMPIELTPQPGSIGAEPMVNSDRWMVNGEDPARPVTPITIHPSPLTFPKTIHQIWLGPLPLPEEAHRFAATWRTHHPDWAYRLWTDADVAQASSLCGPSASGPCSGAQAGSPLSAQAGSLCSAANPALRSDLLRLAILHRFGGLYVDVDFECLRPLDPLLAQVGEDCFAGLESPTVTHTRSLSNALLGARPRARFLAEALRRIPESIRTHEARAALHGPELICRATGPAFLTRLAAACPAITVFPQPLLYPRGENETAHAYARHGYWGSWRAAGQWQTARAGGERPS